MIAAANTGSRNEPARKETANKEPAGKEPAWKEPQARRVAVYESDPFARMAIENALRRAGAETVAMADDRLNGAALALGQYSVEIVGPIVAELKRRGVRYVLYAAQRQADLEALRRLWPGESVLARPAAPVEIAEAIMALFRNPRPGYGEAA